MWIEFSKVAVYFFFCTNVAYAYYSKQDYIKHSEKSLSNRHSASLVSGSSLNNDNLKLRQSRYPKFDKVEKINTQVSPVRIRHKGWRDHRTTTTTTTTTTTDDGLFDTYGDLEDGNDDYDSTLEDDDDEFEYDDDTNDTDDPFSDSIEDVQAEQAEKPAVYSKPSSSFTEYKWKHFGTSSGVAESRRQYQNSQPVATEQRGVKAVLEHYFRVNQQGKCKNPSPKVISVQNEHPDPTKTYTPHCTVLHRCAEDTGCCKHDTKCQWKTRETVHLYFYIKILGSTETKVEKLSFYNDTECECKEKTSNMSGESTSDSSSDFSFKSADSFYRPPQNLIRCKCPKHFQSQTSHNNRCSCDCEEGNIDCIQLKQGKEHLSMTDRICISTNQCSMPVCEYGTYTIKEGKCPSKKEKMDYYRQLRIDY